jgi:hypothetical protein
MSEPTRPYEPLTSENAALDLVDHQVGLMTGSRLFTGELKHNVVALTPPFRGTAASRLQRPDSHICDVYHRDQEWPLHVESGRRRSLGHCLQSARQGRDLPNVSAGVGGSRRSPTR